MAESFTNSLSRAVGVVTTSSSGSVGVTTNHITGISTVGISSGYIVESSQFIYGTRVDRVGIASVWVDRDSTNTAAVSGTGTFKFLGLTSAYTASDKSIIIGGTFANNTESAVNIWIEVHDSSSNTVVGIGQKIPVPTGSSFVITDAGKTLLENTDSIRVYCDTANGVDVALSILKGVS
jgi:hypothetical protein